MSKEIGTLIVPIFATLPATAAAGAIGMYQGNIYTWNGGAWVPNWPVYIDPNPPTGVTSSKYLWVNTSGSGDATLFVQDGV